ncbi:MAG: PEP-CTERM sorting domain-containing protein [Armatimonadetes bacterium]|nr:PEP-CTERM sorting domain-containing protein [Armatimonadota bacterium]
MKRTLLTTLSCLSALAVGPVLAQTPPFPLVQTIGSGSNESFFVLDFEDGSSSPSYAFGYLYNEPATGPQLTGYDLINALVNANIGLTDTVTQYSFGPAIDSFSYAGHSQGGFQNNGYWSYWLSNDGQNWTASNFGPADPHSTLTNGSYDGWAYDVNSQVTNGPVTPRISPAVPEPDAAWLLLAGLPVLLAARRRRARVG